MNTFERHGIDHLSPSSLNHFAADAAHWVMERRLNFRSLMSAAAARGRAVEAGVHAGLMDPDLPTEACVATAERHYDREMALTPDARRDAERKNIPGYVKRALAELRQYGVPTSAQDRVEIRLADVTVPVIGYTDFRFDEHGEIVDLKTSARLPSFIGDAHGRQGAVYAAANSNYAMRFAYVKPSPGKADGRAVAVYEMTSDEIQRHLTALREIALRLERFLALSDDPHELAALLVPNYDDFRWRNPASRAYGAEIFGF